MNRVVVLSLKLEQKPGELYFYDHIVPLNEDVEVKFTKNIETYMSDFNLKAVLSHVFIYLDTLNKIVDQTKPWITIKNDTEMARADLFLLAKGLRLVGLHLYPFFPEKMSEMFEKLGLQ